MTSLFKNEHSDPRTNAQRNLAGRTHYVDPDTLRFHRARILDANATSDGLLFWLIESVQVDPPGFGTTRECRYVIFDLFGTIVGTRAELGKGWRTSRQAEKAMWADLNGLDAKALTLAAIDRETQFQAQEMARLARTVAGVERAVA